MVHLFRIDVDGEAFDVDWQDGTNDVSWITGPNPGYGFLVGRSDRAALSEEQARDRIRGFLASIDPATGFMAD